MSHPLLSALAEDWPAQCWQEVRTVVAVSGGADSVALLAGMVQLCTAAGLAPSARLTVAHFDHRLRENSSADALFVAQLAERLGLPCLLGAAERDLAAHRSGQGLEGAARAARYAFLTQAAETAGARYLLTGHTRDDQVETVLANILRGAGLAGLAGMPRMRVLSPAVTLVRPLLVLPREVVRNFVLAERLSFREDETNADRNFTRNRLRHDLLPLLRRDFAPGVDNALWRLGQIAGDAHACLVQSAAELLPRAVQSLPGGGVQIDRTLLAGAPAAIAIELLRLVWRQQGWPERDLGYERWVQLHSLLGQIDFPGGLRVLGTREQLVVQPLHSI